MRELALFGCAVALMACDPIPPSDDIFSPRKIAPSAASPVAVAEVSDTPEAAPVDDGSFDFDSEDRNEDDGGGEEVDPLQLQARLFGADPSTMPAPAPAPEPTTTSAEAVVTAAPVMGMAPPVWNAGQPLEGSWGIRLVAVVTGVQPPRAVIALSDGTEVVVQPGDMLPEARIVVMAVGANAVQLAHVNPEGFYASVRTETIASLYDATASAPGNP